MCAAGGVDHGLPDRQFSGEKQGDRRSYNTRAIRGETVVVRKGLRAVAVAHMYVSMDVYKLGHKRLRPRQASARILDTNGEVISPPSAPSLARI